MDRRTWLLAGCVLAFLVVGGGIYIGLAGQNAHGSAAYLDVEPAEGNVSANETVAFEELSPAQQELFERARNSSELVEISADLDYTVFAENRYVHYQNRTYEVAVAVS
ncbi:hypothetical protein EGH22_01295 [Halomicroarcula sp. F28]|uniref:hypothetical protein n=1 Tax=Haloarcula salinisoli TaxID=2487746 RepID=UPI001C72CB8B|nr:hypothetical protein [Halomicroarcula salinisoli]MBX0284949.1 hypothetical protein [Halomicroarcula salinisoli]